MKGDFLEGSRGEGERGLNHHGTGDRVMDPLTVGDGAVWSRRMSQESIIFTTKKGACVPLSEPQREKG